MTNVVSKQHIHIEPRNPVRVRIDIDKPLADKLKNLAMRTRRSQSEIIEACIKGLVEG